MQNKNICRTKSHNSGYTTCTFAPQPCEKKNLIIKKPKQRKKKNKIDINLGMILCRDFVLNVINNKNIWSTLKNRAAQKHMQQPLVRFNIGQMKWHNIGVNSCVKLKCD